jgi:rod shape-determining protein MreC
VTSHVHVEDARSGYEVTQRARNLVIVLVAVALTAILLDLRGGSVTSSLRSAAAVLVSPVQRAAAAIASPIVTWVDGAEDFGDPEERARAWAGQVAPSVAPRAVTRAQELDALLAAVTATALSVVPARVVAYPGAGPAVETVLVDAGGDDGVVSDSAVITGAGLVGRTALVAATTSTVVLISSPGNSIGARLTRTGTAGVVAGSGDPRRLLLTLLDAGADVRVGDQLVTFGSKGGRPFPADVPIGTVSAIEGDIGSGRAVVVLPAVDLAALDLVGLVLPSTSRPARSPLPVRSGSPS